MRKLSPQPPTAHALPVDDESRLSPEGVQDEPTTDAPLLSGDVEDSLGQLIAERRQSDRLQAMGLTPTRSAIFVGRRGRQDTHGPLAGRAIEGAAVRARPDSRDEQPAGKSGTNLRAAIDFAKREPCVLLLDEIDAIAKRRSDDSDVGELKRLVTVILQEVDEWPASSVLLAATNHPELIDPALWRRFDQ